MVMPANNAKMIVGYLAGAFPRIHVGRVNTERMLWMAHEAGAESCDGTGWFRGDKAQLAGLMRYLDDSTNGVRDQRNGVPLFDL